MRNSQQTIRCMALSSVFCAVPYGRGVSEAGSPAVGVGAVDASVVTPASGAHCSLQEKFLLQRT